MEAQDFRNQIFRFANKQKSLPTKSPPHRYSNCPRTPIASSPPPPQDQVSPLTSTPINPTPEGQDGSTPKRTRTTSRDSFQTPLPSSSHATMCLPKNSIDRLALASKPRHTRPALRGLRSSSANRGALSLIQAEGAKTRRRYTGVVALPVSDGIRGTQQDPYLDDISFNCSQIFTSTTRDRLDGVPTEDIENYHEGETTEDI